MIKKIQITNVKGIGDGTPNSVFEFDLHPNKPTIFVAPNGFGKSSLAVAFASLNPTKIILNKDHYFKNDENNKPKIAITHINSVGVSETLTADEGSNQLRDTFNWFVINNQVFAKAKRNVINGTVIASASLETPPIILINSVPAKVEFIYSINSQKQLFGSNGKVLKNLGELYGNKKFLKSLSNHFLALERADGQRIRERITLFKDRVNAVEGNAQELKDWIVNNELQFLSETNHLNTIANLVSTFDLGYTSQADNYLTAIQLIGDYNADPTTFKNAEKRQIYELEKEIYTQTFNDFNSSWKDFKPVEKEGKLIIEIPKTVQISNGQRDVMCFVALLKKAELHLIKENCVLIIDEIFDYLDDGNLIAVQYYITQFIQKFVSQGKRLYPIILTHLNPYFFKNFTFSKQKVFFLAKKDAKINPHLKKILIKREHATIVNEVSKYHLHYEPTVINIRPQFEALDLKPTWGDSAIFDAYVDQEFAKYINEEIVYDPFAVCCAIRKKVEKLAYDSIVDPDFRLDFLNTHKTPDKLKFAEEKGVAVPETHYLLGIIYNDGMHWKDNEAAIAGKLENLAIRRMILEIG